MIREQKEPKSFFIIDHDPETVGLCQTLLRNAGHRVESTVQSNDIVEIATKLQPDVILLDLALPDVESLGVLKEFRSKLAFDRCKIVVTSEKSECSDTERALQLGADGLIRKPFDHEAFLTQMQSYLGGCVTLKFWGVRGTLPVSGPGTDRYGGHTSCVSVNGPGGQLIIFDAGTGLHGLSKTLMKQKDRVDAHLLISHPHWDHINCLPFFMPFYAPNNKISVYSPRSPGLNTKELLTSQMKEPFFPVTVQEFKSDIEYQTLDEGHFTIQDVPFEAILLNHPGKCLGYRCHFGDYRICYMTDNEIFSPGTANHDNVIFTKQVEFAQQADYVIIDTTYQDEEYPAKVGWGHSSVSQVCHLAAAAKIQNLVLFHHDPEQVDAMIDKKVRAAKKLLEELDSNTKVLAPREGDEIDLPIFSNLTRAA